MAKKSSGKYWPQDYEGFKVIKAWIKKRSPRAKIWATNDPEEWFIDILDVAKKTGEVKTSEGWVIKKDIEGWSDWYKSLGYEEISIEDLTIS